MEFPEFNRRAREALERIGDSYPPWPELVTLTEWPDHMARALDAILEYENGRRPWMAWVDELREQMQRDGALV